MKKMNNKGFSLVELIVVVLIMAIIAVALAPQVMKWVENSRISTDCETYDQLISNIQLALTDKAAYAEVKGQANDPSFAITDTADVAKTNVGADFTAALVKVNSSWDKARAKVSGASYTITVDHTTVTVQRTAAPDAATGDGLE